MNRTVPVTGAAVVSAPRPRITFAAQADGPSCATSPSSGMTPSLSGSGGGARACISESPKSPPCETFTPAREDTGSLGALVKQREDCRQAAHGRHDNRSLPMGSGSQTKRVGVIRRSASKAQEWHRAPRDRWSLTGTAGATILSVMSPNYAGVRSPVSRLAGRCHARASALPAPFRRGSTRSTGPQLSSRLATAAPRQEHLLTASSWWSRRDRRTAPTAGCAT
jgi:hypothetical protein